MNNMKKTTLGSPLRNQSKLEMKGAFFSLTVMIRLMYACHSHELTNTVTGNVHKMPIQQGRFVMDKWVAMGADACDTANNVEEDMVQLMCEHICCLGRYVSSWIRSVTSSNDEGGLWKCEWFQHAEYNTSFSVGSVYLFASAFRFKVVRKCCINRLSTCKDNHRQRSYNQVPTWKQMTSYKHVDQSIKNHSPPNR